MSKVGIIIQTRMDSNRLPGKAMLPLGKAGKPMIEWVYNACKRAQVRNPKIEKVIVATTDRPVDKKIEDWCWSKQAMFFKGTEEPLSRYYECAKKFGLDIIIRVCGDCPFLSPPMIAQLLDLFIDRIKMKEYIALAFNRRNIPGGWDCEIFTYNALEMAHLNTHGPDREHVTLGMRSVRFEDLSDIGTDMVFDFRLDVDTPEDYERAKKYAEWF